MQTKTYRVGAIGHTGCGNYGHNLHLAYASLEGVDFVAVADPDVQGREQAALQTKAQTSFADYRDMLRQSSLDIVSICPRWVSEHEEMLLASIEAGCHIFCEKPMTADLASADRVVDAAKRNGVKIAVAHQAVYLPQVHATRELVQNGRIGKLVSVQAFGKQDHRGGGEDTLVLGTHIFNLMRFFCGDPHSVWGCVSQDGQDVTVQMAREANEPIGLIAGDSIQATYQFDDDVYGHFVSRKYQPGKSRGYGLVLVGDQGQIALSGDAGSVCVLDTDVWAPWLGDQVWASMDLPMGTLQGDGNRLAVMDLIGAVEKDGTPISSAVDARWALEMIHGIYAAHLTKTRVSLPLPKRSHPLATSGT